MSFTVYQNNLGRGIAASSSLLSTLSPRAIALLQEPYCAKPFKKPSFIPPSHISFSASCHLPRAAIVVPIEIGPACLPLLQFSNRDCIAIRISSPSNSCPDYILCSYYMDITFNGGSSPMISPTFSSLVDHCNSNNIPLITGMDSNAHHTAWLSRDTNPRGITLLDFFSSTALLWANTSSNPTYVTKRSSSLIDLTVYNRCAASANLVTNWTMNAPSSLSDHCIISFNLKKGRNPPSTSSAFSLCDMEKCRNSINHELSSIILSPTPSTSRLDSTCSHVLKIINKCHIAACPIVRLKHPKSSPWWTKECSISKATVVARKRHAIRSNSRNHWTLYNDGKKAFKKLIKSSKKKGWKGYCTGIKSTPVASRLRKTLADRSSARLGTLTRPDGTTTNTPLESLNTLASTLFPGAPPPLIEKIQGINLDPSSILTPDRIQRALALITSGKAAGPDAIRPEVIKECWPEIGPCITYLFHHSLRLGHIPAPWASSTGCILPKPGKKDYSSPKAFRIISLSSHLLKLLERLVLWHLQLDLAIPAALKDTQYGFTRGSSTAAAIHKIQSRIEEALAAGNYALGVFLDIEGAFDKISFKAIHEALINAGVGPTITNWITALISTRSTTLSLASASISFLARAGCPQGGVLSPFLWNLVLDSLLKSFPTWPDPITAFADDLSLVVIGLDLSTLVYISQEHIRTCEAWCHTKGLTISHVKTQAVIFCRNKKLRLPRPLKVNNQPVPYVPTAKYLGVTLDSKLNWKAHIQAASAKATSTLFSCKRAIGPNWGLSPAVTRFIYTAIIRPSLAYAAVCWVHKAHLTEATTNLKKPQRLATLMITRAFPSTNSDALDIICALPPIGDYILAEALKGRSALKACNRWVNTNIQPAHSHALSLSEKAAIIPELAMPHDATSPSLILTRPYTTIIEPRADHGSYIFNTPDHLYIFTDGSKMNNLTGAGMVCLLNGAFFEHTSIALGAYPTVFQSELFAITMACRTISTLNNPLHTSIHSDSQPALKAISNSIVRSQTVSNCINDLQASSQTCLSLSLHWVPGHYNIEGNDLADQLAREGSSNHPIGPEPFLPLSGATVSSAIKSYFAEKQLSSWESNDVVSRKCHAPILAILESKPKGLKPLPDTATLREYTHLMTGHSYLNYFQHITGVNPSPLCLACNESNETSEHLLCLCPAFSILRIRHFGFAEAPISLLAAIFGPTQITNFIRATGRSLERPSTAN